MRLAIQSILDHGVPGKERLWLKALADADLSFYIVFKSRYLTPNSVARTQNPAFWFASKMVKAGDYVVLVSGPGVDNSMKQPDGTEWHFLYWGLPQPIWGRPEDCALLFEIGSWQASAK